MLTLWITLAVVGQLFYAVSVLIDKYVLVTPKGIGRPIVYVFYVSLLSAVVLLLAPFGVGMPSAQVVWLSVASAVSFMFSIYLLYSALQCCGKASDIVPVIGALSAITTFALAFVFLDQDLSEYFYVPFALLVIGTLFISHFRFTLRLTKMVIFSGIFFGTSVLLMKILFLEAGFLDGFFWSRMANVGGALFILAMPAWRSAIFGGTRSSSSGVKWLVVGNKVLSGAAAALTFVAIYLGSVSVVNAMAGLQFVFILAFAYFFGSWFPAIFSGEIHPHKFPHKLYGVILIAAGLAFLYLL